MIRMQFRNTSIYDLMTITSMGIRITPVNRQPIHVSKHFEMQATSAETNVLNISASLGLKTKALTKFVRNSEIAQFIKSELKSRNIEFESAEIDQGGPWGYRHQFNIADNGYGVRGPRVLNDRAGEVGRTIMATDFDIKRIFEDDGCKILHISGIIVALSPDTTQACLTIAKAAKKSGTVISFDINYRESFWVNRENELHDSFKEIASLADILIGNEEDFQLALGYQGPEAGGKGLSHKIESFKSMIERVSKDYPNAKAFATTLREVNNAGSHDWGAILLASGEWFVETPREIPVYDRIGGGDGFVGGLLYGALREWKPEMWLQFGWATGALATTMLTDYASPVDEDQVWSIYKGNARVKR